VAFFFCRLFPFLSVHYDAQILCDVAANGRVHSFLSHQSTQRWLSAIYFNGMQLKRNRRVWLHELSLAEPFVFIACVLFVWPINHYIHFPSDLLHQIHDSTDSQFFAHYPYRSSPQSESRPTSARTNGYGRPSSAVRKIKEEFSRNSKASQSSRHVEKQIFAYLRRLVSDSTHEQTCSESKHSHHSLADFHLKPDDWLDLSTGQAAPSQIEPNEGANKDEDEEQSYFAQPTVRLSIGRRWLILTNAPVTKFWLSHLFYIAYLCLFTLTVLQPACGQPRYDLILFVWHGSNLLENLHRSHRIFSQLISIHLTGLKYVELLFEVSFLLLLYLGRILHVQWLASHQYYVRMCMCVALLKAYMKYVGTYTPIHPRLGPLYYYLKQMSLRDSLRFLALCTPFMVSFGVAIQIALYPDQAIDSKSVLRIVYRSVYSMFLSTDPELLPTAACEQQRLSGWELASRTADCRISQFRSAACANGGAWSYLFMFTFLMLQRMVLNNILSECFSRFLCLVGEMCTPKVIVFRFRSPTRRHKMRCLTIR
jgi:hypothetical protein